MNEGSGRKNPFYFTCNGDFVPSFLSAGCKVYHIINGFYFKYEMVKYWIIFSILLKCFPVGGNMGAFNMCIYFFK